MRILIVGAGIAGCTLYRRLRSQNLSVDIIEKSSTLESEGIAICLPANAMLELKYLDLSDQVTQYAFQVDQVEYALSSGKTLAVASLHKAPLNIAPFVALKKDDLMSVLREGMLDEIQLNTWPIKINQNSTKAVVTLNSGETQEYDLVVAADGIRSGVREMVQPDVPLRSHQITNWRFIAQKPKPGFQPIYYIGHDSAFMIYPISESEVYCYGQINDENGEFSSKPSIEAITSIFENYDTPVAQCVKGLNEEQKIVRGQLKSVQNTDSVFDRVVLVGDALHGCPPSLQQGVGMSLEDINCLADNLEHSPLEVALDNYKKIRSERVALVVNESNKIIKLATLGRSPIGRLIRNNMIRLKGPANVVSWCKLLKEL